MAAIRELECDLSSLQHQDLRPIDLNDFKLALNHVKPSVSKKDIENCYAWNKEFGSYQM